MSDKLWGGRFSSDITDSVLAYTETASVDTRMLKHDLWQNLAHVLMLGEVGVNDFHVTSKLVAGLLELESERSVGNLPLRIELEDVHFNTERMLIDRVGEEIGGRMHTARSRNDQVQTDARMVTREWLVEAITSILGFAQDLLSGSDEELRQVIPGYTHSQAAQPISIAFWKSAHAESLIRDAERLANAWDRVNTSPLGSCALAGTSFALDRGMTADYLGFTGPMRNALDATSTRDWTVEISAAVAVAATGISRMQEEVVVWSSNEFSLVEVDDSFATGSSIMPQKKNPVVAELARGKCGRAAGALVQMLMMEKSVGLGYSCDLQDDKPFYWDALDTYLSTVNICRQQNASMRFNSTRGIDLCWKNFSTATELANFLVTDYGVPFRTSHRITGELVAFLISRQETLRDFESCERFLRENYEISIELDKLATIFDPVNAVDTYISEGGTSPASVSRQRQLALSSIDTLANWVEQQRSRVEKSREKTFDAAKGFLKRSE